MITKDEVLEILYKHSRNSGDYVPDYNFDKVAEEISKVRNLPPKSREIVGITEEHLTSLRESWEPKGSGPIRAMKTITKLIDYIAYTEGWDVGQPKVKPWEND